MNKSTYQEALELLKGYKIKECLNIVEKVNYNARLEKIIDLLQELVEIYPEYLELKAKATPKKTIKKENGFTVNGLYYTGNMYDYCPNCNSDEVRSQDNNMELNYCSNCGQALDWSEDE